MKWIEKIIVNKESRLPWLEIHSGKNPLDQPDEVTTFLDYNPENPLKSSLKEVISLYNHDIGFQEEEQTGESDFEEPETGEHQNMQNEFIPLSNLSDKTIEEDIFPEDTEDNDISKYSFSVFNKNDTDTINEPFIPEFKKSPITFDEEKSSNDIKNIHSPGPSSIGNKNPDFISNEFIFQMEGKLSDRNFFTMEVDLEKTTDSQSGIREFDNDLVQENELPVSPSEKLLLSPLTAVKYDDLIQNDLYSLESDLAPEVEDLPFPNDGNTDLNPFLKKTAPSAEETHEKKNNFRCSITPELSTAPQFRIPFDILATGKETYDHSDPAEVQHVIEKLESTLEQFGIEARVIGMQKGPIITRYEIRIPPGIKVNRILGLTDELAMALEALRVRIEAPIPGRSTVGIEIPNKKRSTVLLGDVLNHPDYDPHSVRLPLPLGKDIAGNNIIEDLTRMPHILIAGATGSGKSVAINSIITSMIISKSPEDVRLLMVDPKLVELSQYNDIPHLLHPVIADPQKAIAGLNWAVEEMERRYEDMADMRARDIVSYNLKVDAENKKGKLNHDSIPKMPYIVILIDELGDLMMVAGKEVESSIIRLSQKARAIGIHLILATQRPSVDVITALIKANCPARIALQVAQKTDSRTILDSNGGEQLLGQGDMLFKHPSRAQLIRAQAPYVSDQEVENVVHTIKEMAKPSYIVLEDPKSRSGELELEDEDLFEEAWEIITESNKASASYLQRRLRIGYNRAARLIEAFEARGYIGPQVGSKPREILGNH